MWIETHAETSETPAEYRSTCPIECATCGYEHDKEEDYGENFNYIDDKAYCILKYNGDKTCYLEAVKVSFREKSAEMISESIDSLLEKLGNLYNELGTAGDVGLGSPWIELEDLLARLPRWVEGKDTGYRRELMMTNCEMSELHYQICRRTEFNLLRSLMDRSKGIDVE